MTSRQLGQFGVSANTNGDEVVLQTRYLGGGERCRFRAIATAELQSREVDSENFTLPRRRRGFFVQVTQTCTKTVVQFSAVFDSGGLGGVSPEKVLWHSDLDGELGKGTEFQRVLSPGRHEITAQAPDGLGGTLTERSIIVVDE